VIRYDFEHCYVIEIPDEHRIETHYPDGSVASGVPQDTAEYRATARALGYGDDVWAMTREHELLHTAIAELRGEQHSGALWAQAHKPDGYQFDPSKMPWRGQAEEERLFRLQRLLNRMRGRA
jgi:hypothetical protein